MTTDRDPGMPGMAAAAQEQQLRREVAAQVAERIGWIEDAATAIGGEDARVEAVFPLAPETRKDAPEPEWKGRPWDSRQIAIARETGHRLGYGAEQNVSTGLQGGRRISEGGLYWKVKAQDGAIDEEIRAAQGALAEYLAAGHEGDVAVADPPAQITEVDYAGTVNRPIRDDERSAIMFDIEWLTADAAHKRLDSPEDRADRALMERHLAGLKGLLRPGSTEYDMARVFARRRAAQALRPQLVEAYREGHPRGAAPQIELPETMLPFGYQVLPGSRLEPRNEATGQLVQIGVRGSIRLLRVDRDGSLVGMPGSSYSQPDAAALMGFVAHVATEEGAYQAPVGFMTSNTYASRVPDAFRAGLGTGHQTGVGMYGRQELAVAKHAEVQPDTPLNQLPGDLRSYYDKLRMLSAELSAV